MAHMAFTSLFHGCCAKNQVTYVPQKLIVHERHTTDLFQSGQRKDVVSLANQVVLFGSRDFPHSFYHLLQ